MQHANTNQFSMTGISNFFGWWKRTLVSNIPAKIRNFYALPPMLASIKISQDNYKLAFTRARLIGDNKSIGSFQSGNLSDIFSKLTSQKRRWRSLMGVEIVLPLHLCLELNRDIPTGARDQAENILNFDFERIAPLPKNAAYLDHFVYLKPDNRNTLGAKMIIAKRSLIDPLLNWLISDGFVLYSVGVEDEDGKRLPIELLPRDIRNRSAWSLSDWFDRILKTLAAAIVFVGVYAMGMQVWQLSNLHNGVDRQLGRTMEKAKSITSQAKFLNTQIALSETLRLRKTENPMLMEVLEEISKTLPMSAYVQKINLRGNELNMIGFASSASTLIRTFSKSDLFDTVKFQSPVTLDSASQKERFDLQIVVSTK